MVAHYLGISSTELILTVYDRDTRSALFSVTAVGYVYKCVSNECNNRYHNLIQNIRNYSQEQAKASAYLLLGNPYPYFDKYTQYIDYQYNTSVVVEYTSFNTPTLRSHLNIQPLFRLINSYPQLLPVIESTCVVCSQKRSSSTSIISSTPSPSDTTAITFVLQNATEDKNNKQIYLYCTYSSMALGSSDGCITEGWWLVAYNKVDYTDAGFYSYTEDGVTYSGYCSNKVGGYDGNTITFNFYETFFDTSSAYYGNVTFYISDASLLQQPQSLIDNYGSYNNTYTFNWQNGNNYDPYTGAYFGGDTVSGTYYDVPLPYYTNGLSGVNADSNYFLEYTDNYSYSITLQNASVQYWGSNQNYNYFTIPDSTNTVSLVFYPASGSRGCYTISDGIIYQTAPPLTNWSASAFLAQATQYIDGVLTLLTPSEAMAYGIAASTGTWQIDLLCGDNSNTLSVNFYLTQRAYLSPESPTNKYYEDGQKSNGAVLEADVYESYWCSHNGKDFESNFFLGGASKNYNCYASPGDNTTTWIRMVMAVGDNGDGTTSYSYQYYSFDPTTGLPSATPFDGTVTTIDSTSVQPLYPYITIYSPSVSTTASVLGTSSVTSQYGNYFYTTSVTGDNLPSTPYPGYSG